MSKKKTPPKIYQVGEIVTTESFSKDQNISEITAREILIDKLHMKKITMMYRVNSKHLKFNPWTPQLGLLNQIWNLEDGTKINGGEPQNIEVGFMVCVEF